MHAIRSALLALLLLATWPVSFAATPHAVPGTSTAVLARDLAVAAIGDRRLVFFGEMHGTQETPALVADVIDAYAAHGRPVVLALEIGTEEQPRFDRYVASRGLASDRAALLGGMHWREVHHDGRDSRAMFELIDHMRRLRARGTPIALVAFDGGGTDMGSRNRRMAEVLRATAGRFPRSRLLVLTGNVHAMTRKPSWSVFDGGKRIELPMTAAQHLADLAPLSIDVKGASGAYWACTASDCRMQAIGSQAPQQGPTLMRNAPDDAWDVTLVLPHFTPSPPAIQAVAPPARAVNP